MNLTRPIMFWIATCAVIAAVVLLREILLPFVAGIVLAYLFNPLANRLERFGLSRLLAALAIIGAFIVGWVALLLLTARLSRGNLPTFSTICPSTSGHCRIPVRDRRASARGAARGGLPRAPAFRDEAILCEPALCHPPG
jgi:hypothetical protein